MLSTIKRYLKSKRKILCFYTCLKSKTNTNEKFENAYKQFLSVNDNRFNLKEKDIMPFLNDMTENTDFDRHYIFHTAWAARLLSEEKPEKHIDISSAIYFNTIVSAFINIEFYDYRPANISLSGLITKSADLVNLNFESNSIESLSCMHVIEHIGLGRYGDPIDPSGDIKAANELSRVLKKEGQLLIVVPVGRERIEFNAHRIYSYEMVLSLFKNLKLLSCTLIPDNREDGDLINNPEPSFINKQNWGCGCFLFTKE